MINIYGAIIIRIEERIKGPYKTIEEIIKKINIEKKKMNIRVKIK